MYSRAQKFYDAMGFPRPVRPTKIAPRRRNELMAYVLSEVLEFGASAQLCDQVDAATDLLYFVMDIFVEMGVDPSVPFDIVHTANMAKQFPEGQARFDYSVIPPRMLKPDEWVAPEEAIKRWLESVKNGHK